MPAFIPTFKYKVIKILLNHLLLTLCNLIVCVCVCVRVCVCVCVCVPVWGYHRERVGILQQIYRLGLCQ